MSSTPVGKVKARNGVGEKKEYPEPLASHQDLVMDPVAFWDTLRRFHFIMGTKFMYVCLLSFLPSFSSFFDAD